MKKEECCNNNFGMLSVVFGVLSVLFSVTVMFGFSGGMVLAILALIFSIIQIRREKNSWAITGLILAIVGVIASIVVGIFTYQVVMNALASVSSQMAAA
jgi:asparagine N-glycosylation enzyme membrane subunit Stt3